MGDDWGASPDAPAPRASVTVAAWTVVSRVTGFGKVAAIAAVLGPTYLGNTFQATNLLPNLTFEFLTGTLFTLLLVPRLVGHVDRDDLVAAERVAGGFLGVTLVTFGVVAVAAILAGPVLLGLFSVGVDSPAVAGAQRRVGWLLMAMLMPQVMFYGIAGVAGAAMNARGRFALAAAGPAIENVGVILTMVATAVVFGTGSSVEDVATAELVLLGLGATGAVAVHAGTVWLGARHAGIRLVPRAGWRDPEVRAVVREAVPSLGYSGMNAVRVFAILVVANRVPGGVVAFQVALNFSYLPVAIGTRPVAVTMLPQLARLHLAGATQRFRDELARGVNLTFFLVVPATVAYIVLARPLAGAVSFGEMSTTTGVTLVAVSLAALGPGVLGDSLFVMATHASYARQDARSPVAAMVTRAVVAIVGMVVAYVLAEGSAVLATVGLAISVGNLVSAAYLGWRVRADLPGGAVRIAPSFIRALGASAGMAVPAHLLAYRLPDWTGGRVNHTLAVAVAAAVGGALFLAIQWSWRAPELGAVSRALRRRGLREDRSSG